MKRITRDVFDRITLDASLQRLGVVELEERMEFSPLLVEGGLQDTDRAANCCVCKIPGGDPLGPDDGGWQVVRIEDYLPTGPTDGNVGW